MVKDESVRFRVTTDMKKGLKMLSGNGKLSGNFLEQLVMHYLNSSRKTATDQLRQERKGLQDYQKDNDNQMPEVVDSFKNNINNLEKRIIKYHEIMKLCFPEHHINIDLE